MAENEKGSVVPSEEMHAFVLRCMTRVGTPDHHAKALADLLTAADLRDHYSHGLNRLDMYVRDIQSGMTAHDTEPSVVKETAATALVEGNNVLGPVVGRYCMDLAIQKARQSGIGWVSARGSNHFGIAGWYSMRAMEQGMLGMAFTNTSPLMVPTRARKPTLGTNPLSLAAPGQGGDGLVLDMATTAVALGKVELNDRKGMNIPAGWGVDSTGKTCTDPKPVVESGGLMPLGGTEECSGYKGYGLGMMVEVFCGLLSGASYGPNVRRWKTNDRPANLGQCFIAIDPSAFAEGFANRMSDLMNHCRNLEPVEGEREVLVPGDPERQHIEKCQQLGGIPYHPNQIKYASDLAAELKIQPMKTL
ncbi:putative oxidoreductase YjmC [Babylonia areolata]|uniref:putative oxidoreductase YjmC n=1 Tax=Babylonia areolata TaxID=304850 RepID=UPI003FD08200